MRKATSIYLACAGALLTAAMTAQGETVTSFEPFSTTPTPGVWYESDVRTGGAAAIVDLAGLGGDLESNQPLPVGAAKLTTDFTNAAKAEVGLANNFGTVNGILGTLSIQYAYHKASNSGQNLSAAPSLKLAFHNASCLDPVSAGDCFGQLVYEPTWNGVPSGASTAPALDTWAQVTIDAGQGVFWWTGGFGQGNTAGGPPLRTLNDWAAVLSSDFPGASLVGIAIGVGSFNQGQVGYFDAVSISGTGADGDFDFEPAPLFETLGECVSTLIAEHCSSLKGRARANCNHEQQMVCFDIFKVP